MAVRTSHFTLCKNNSKPLTKTQVCSFKSLRNSKIKGEWLYYSLFSVSADCIYKQQTTLRGICSSTNILLLVSHPTGTQNDSTYHWQTNAYSRLCFQLFSSFHTIRSKYGAEHLSQQWIGVYVWWTSAKKLLRKRPKILKYVEEVQSVRSAVLSNFSHSEKVMVTQTRALLWGFIKVQIQPSQSLICFPCFPCSEPLPPWN